MIVRWAVHLLAASGIASSAIYLFSMHASVGYTVFLSGWLSWPYLFLARINESRPDLHKRPLVYLPIVGAMISVGAIFMLDTAVFHPDPLGEVAMIFLPPLQLLCLLGLLELRRT